MSGIQAKEVVKYAVLPGIIPRLKALFASGFGYTAFLMAQIYALVRLLPPNHAYLNPQNIGQFGVRHVIAETANNLIISKQNIDQITVFVLMLVAIVLLISQLVLLLASLFFGPVFAGPPGFSLFITQNPDLDIAFMLLDQVFGIGPINGTPFFNSCVAAATLCPGETVNPPFPWPFHLALQNMFRFYSIGILLIGMIIFLYFLVVVVVETATTGSPFGQRFQNVWVPIRLVVAVGLLIPLSWGYNSGQYITFAAAKFGSSLATNGWTIYNNNINAAMGGLGNPIGERENLIARPKPPDAAVLAQAMSIVHACAFAEYLHHQHIAKSGTPVPPGVSVPYPDPVGNINAYQTNRYAVKPYFVKNPQQWQAVTNAQQAQQVFSGTTYDDAINFYTRGDIIIRFGVEGAIDTNGDGTISPEEQATFDAYPGNIQPTCGDIRIPVSDRRPTAAGSNVHTPAAGGVSDGYLGGVAMQRLYFEMVRDLWFIAGGGGITPSENMIDFAGRITILSANRRGTALHNACNMGCQPQNPHLPSCSAPAAQHNQTPARTAAACATVQPESTWKQNAINNLQTEINTQTDTIWQTYNAQTNEFRMDLTLLNRGWGGAGIWYNTLAKANSAFADSVLNIPYLEQYPLIMVDVAKKKDMRDRDPSGIEQYNPNTAGSSGLIQLNNFMNGMAKAIAMFSVIKYWHESPENAAIPNKVLDAGSFENAVNLTFGTYGLFAMTDENANIHPLSQLVILGKGLVENAIKNVAGSTMAAALGGAIRAHSANAGKLADAASGFLFSTAFIGLTAGFVLFYVLPFLPFLYFYFAVASWIKTIFEAMVGVPLWALAHLRLDGEGLPGESAANGYFLIFEIFIRPILSIFGLVASMIIFTSLVRVLNFIWPLVTENVGGHVGDTNFAGQNAKTRFELDLRRSVIDQFFYTVLYATIVYMLATASFKLIDKIPDNILRWMGQGVSSFGDINQDPTESLTKYAALGGMTAGRQAAEGVKNLGGSLGRIMGGGGGTPSDRRLKENIEPLGLENGIPVYLFSYIGEETRYKGVMAQDVLGIKPEAVTTHANGYLAVYYDEIGIEMEIYDSCKHVKDRYNG